MPHELRLFVLPPELFRPIVQHLNRKSLCAISLACRMLQDEGQRQLYRKISSSSSSETHTNFLRSIIDNNRLALFVQEYAQYSIAHYQRDPLWNYLCRGLQAMVNLKVLKFRALDGHPSAEILADCTFQLRALIWGNRNDEDHLSQFLRSQHSLQRLALDWATSEDKRSLILPSFCPRLNILYGNRAAMETFLPGRKITSLAWLSPDPPASRGHSVTNLSSYLSGIRFFAYGEDFNKPSIISTLECLPSVEVFELKFRRHTYLELEPLLPLLKEMRIFVISTLAGGAVSPIPIAKRPQICSSLFKSCKKLEQIHISLDKETYQTYRRITGPLDPPCTLTSYEEVRRWWHI